MSEVASSTESRADISVFWRPGCSSCLMAKEFLARRGYDFESVNILEKPSAMAEIEAAGLQGVPVVRKGDKYVYAQSLDDLAAFFGATRSQRQLPNQVLVDRWADLQEKARLIIGTFEDGIMDERRIPGSARTIKELSEHTFQVVESFLRQVEDHTIDARAIYLHPNPALKTRQDLLDYVAGIHREFVDWRMNNGPETLPRRLDTHYGNQPSERVLERSVWHMAQHARQLDSLASDMGADLLIPAELYEGLPLPERLWA